jgi:hypothetical protein
MDPEAVGVDSGDVVVAVAKPLWRGWLGEGSAAGEPPSSASEFHWTIGNRRPRISPGGRVYIVAFGRVRGYSRLLRVDTGETLSLVRGPQATAVTIDEDIPGFRGWRYRWWPRSAERPFPDWQTEGVPEAYRARLRPVTAEAFAAVLAALSRDDLAEVGELLQGLRFSPQPGAPIEDAILAAIVAAVAPRGRELWYSRLAPFLVEVGAASAEETATSEVIGPDVIEPRFDDWCLQFSTEWLRDAASKAQRFNAQYLTEICFSGFRKGFAARLNEINVDTGGALMERVAGTRLRALEARYGRDQLLELAHWWVWAELWFAYSRARQKKTTVDLGALFVEKIDEVYRATSAARLAATPA